MGRGFHATPHPDNSSIYGVRFTHPILQSVTLFITCLNAHWYQKQKTQPNRATIRAWRSHAYGA